MMRKIFLIFGFMFALLVYLHADMEKTAEEKTTAIYTTGAKSKKEKIAFYVSKGDEYLLRSEYSYAIDFYTKAKEIKEKNSEVLFRLGEAYRLADMKNEAINSYNKALKYGAKDTRIFLGLGAIYKVKYLYEKSEEYYKKALEMEKNNIIAIKGLAEIYGNEGKYSEAINFYHKEFQIMQSDEIKLNLALLYILSNNYEEARKYVNTISGQSSDRQEGNNILNGYLSIGKNLNSAISQLSSANEHLLLAMTYIKKNDFVNAKSNLNILINQTEDTLSRKLAIVLYKSIK
ncbi:MAG: tetratricopeptide repeat protein [Elusimicrobia bacterium]|nr:tetratricopeptide repeat protein [Elusimicrobiota bacterium]